MLSLASNLGYTLILFLLSISSIIYLSIDRLLLVLLFIECTQLHYMRFSGVSVSVSSTFLPVDLEASLTFSAICIGLTSVFLLIPCTYILYGTHPLLICILCDFSDT